MIKTADGKEWDVTKERLVGSVKAVRSRDINREAKVGEFPVFVEQYGSYRMYTYNKKLVSIA